MTPKELGDFINARVDALEKELAHEGVILASVVLLREGKISDLHSLTLSAEHLLGLMTTSSIRMQARIGRQAVIDQMASINPDESAQLLRYELETIKNSLSAIANTKQENE